MFKSLVLSLAAFGLISAPIFGSALAAEDGKALYDKKCKMCHAEDGSAKKDGQWMAQAKKAKSPEKANLNRAMTDEEIKKSMTDGFETMKPVKNLNDEQLKALVDYTKTLKK